MFLDTIKQTSNMELERALELVMSKDFRHNKCFIAEVKCIKDHFQTFYSAIEKDSNVWHPFTRPYLLGRMSYHFKTLRRHNHQLHLYLTTNDRNYFT